MAASQFPTYLWTDDSGTPSTPVGDGTELNNAELQTFIGHLNAMFSGGSPYNPLTFGAGIATEGYDANGLAINSGGSRAGGLIARIRNTSNNSGASAELRVGNDGAENAGRLIHTSTTFTPAGFVVADGFTILGTRVGGLNLGASHASGLVRQMGKSGYDVGRPAQITTNQTDYTFGSDDSGFYVLTSNAAVSISGLAGGVDGRRIRIKNGNAQGGDAITLVNNAGSNGNKVLTSSGGNLGLNGQAMVDLVYDAQADGGNGAWCPGAQS